MVQVSNTLVRSTNGHAPSAQARGAEAIERQDSYGKSTYFTAMTPLDLFLRACWAGFSALLLLVSLLAYRRRREGRLALVATAFGLSTVAALLVLLAPFAGLADFGMSAYLVILNLAILLALYLALLKR
jgi:hypothetical protein